MERITATLVSLFPDAHLQHCAGLLSLRFYCYGIIVLYISEIPLLFSLLIQYGLDYQAAVVKGKIQRAGGVRSWVNSWYNENNCLTCFTRRSVCTRPRMPTYVCAGTGRACRKREWEMLEAAWISWQNGVGWGEKENLLCDAPCSCLFPALLLWKTGKRVKIKARWRE